MCGATLVGTKLRGSDLDRADLRDAILMETELRGASLRNVNLVGVQFEPVSVPTVALMAGVTGLELLSWRDFSSRTGSSAQRLQGRRDA